MRSRLLALCLACVAVPAAAAQPEKAAEASGIKAFLRHPHVVDAQLSPGGTYLAVITADEGQRSLVFIHLATRKVTSGLRPSRLMMVGSFLWVDDERVAVQLLEEHDYLQSPVSRGRLYLAYASGKTGNQLSDRPALALARIPGDRPRVLIATDTVDKMGDRPLVLRRLDVEAKWRDEGELTNPAPHVRVFTDQKGEPRIAWGLDEELRARVFHREPDGKWQKLGKLPAVGASAVAEGYAPHDHTLYLVEPQPPGFAVVAVQLGTGERKVLSRNDLVPPSGLTFDQETQQLLAVEYEPDLPVYDFPVPDHPVSRALRGLLAAFPDEHVRLVNRTDDGKQALVHVFSDRNPGRFLLVDLASLSAEPVAESQPWIRPAEMAEKTAFHVKASDGLLIHGYVTLPRGLPAGATPPLVVMPHGGPHFVRDHWEYDAEAQLLASQGFAVLQVNYRGSGGYGAAYQEAGYKKWGTRMVEDVVDATRYAVRKGWGDPGRICTYGGSYGAYAAMQMAILAPELVRCAAGVAGIYDLRALPREDHVVLSRLSRGYMRQALGADDDQALRSQSPAHNAGKLTARVLLIHGKHDSIAPIDHAEALRDALTKAGRTPEWLVEPKEGHGFYGEAALERMYTRLVAFLKENTAPLAAPPPPAAAPAGAGPAPAAAPAR